MRGQRGQTLPFIGMMVFLLLGIIGLSVDAGYYRYSQRIQQTATDSAAIAGAKELASTGTAGATSSAKADAATNGFTDGSNSVTVSVNPNYSDSFTTGTSAVQVTISKPYPKYFGGVLGGGTVTVTTTAVAHMVSGNNDCIIQTNASGAANFHGSVFLGPNCGIAINGSANFNSATITSASIGYAGSAPNTTGATFTGATPAPMLPAPDPCPNITGCAYLANNPPSTSSCTSGNYHSTVVTLNQGCYGSLNLSNATVTLNPGVYVMTANWNVNGATIIGSGVTLVGTTSACVNFNGATVNLSAPTTGNTAGMLIYQDPATSSSSCSPNFNSSTDVVAGVMYYPSVSVNFNGSYGGYTVIVAGSANLNSSTSVDPAPGPSGTYIKEASLAE